MYSDISVTNRILSDAYQTFPTTFPAVSSVVAVIKSSSGRVYANSLVAVSFQLHGPSGESLVSLAGTTISIQVSTDGHSPVSASCATPSLVDGSIGSCSITIPTVWFVEDIDKEASIQVKVQPQGGSIVESNVLTLILARAIEYNPVEEAGMTLVYSAAEIVAGNSFNAQVTANTANNPLTVWHVSVFFDVSVIESVTVTTSSKYLSAVVVNSPGKVTMSTSGVAYGVTNDMVTGSSVEVFSVTAKTISTAVENVHTNAISMVVNSMVNDNSIEFITSAAAKIWDGLNDDSQNTQGNLHVISPSVVAIFAFTAQFSLVNLAPLTNIDTTEPITTVAVWNIVTKPNGVITSGRTCSVDSFLSHVLSVDGDCVIVLGVDQRDGASIAPIQVSYGNLSSHVWLEFGIQPMPL
jgi:hypothetical protein